MNYKNILKEQLLSELAYNKGNAKVPSYLRKVVDGIKPIKTPISKGNLINIDLKKISPENLDIIRPIDGSGRPKITPNSGSSLEQQRISPFETPRPRYRESDNFNFDPNKMAEKPYQFIKKPLDSSSRNRKQIDLKFETKNKSRQRYADFPPIKPNILM